MKKFTLLELMVVVAIIGILMSILLPSLNKARRQAMGAVCKNNLKQISFLTSSYLENNNERYMKVPHHNNNVHPNWYLFFTQIEPTVLPEPQRKVLECPVIFSLYPPNNTPSYHRNYGINKFLPGFLSTEIKDPTDMILIGDGFNHNTNNGNPNPGYYANRISGGAMLGGIFDFIHNKKKNLVFADGHVEAKTRPFCSGRTRYWDPEEQ